MSRYLTLNNYDGSLGGLPSMFDPEPAGPYDVASPGGLASIQHHWSHGLFGRPEQYSDAYFGTGDRYIAAEYGNLYNPGQHASIYELQYGPNSAQTEYHNFSGEPYYWMNPVPKGSPSWMGNPPSSLSHPLPPPSFSQNKIPVPMGTGEKKSPI